jgi:hypothetical protein
MSTNQTKNVKMFTFASFISWIDRMKSFNLRVGLFCVGFWHEEHFILFLFLFFCIDRLCILNHLKLKLKNLKGINKLTNWNSCFSFHIIRKLNTDIQRWMGKEKGKLAKYGTGFWKTSWTPFLLDFQPYCIFVEYIYL